MNIQTLKNNLLQRFALPDKELRDRFNRLHTAAKLRYSEMSTPCNRVLSYSPEPYQYCGSEIPSTKLLPKI